VTEDSINKPFRRLVTGYSSYRTAIVRCTVVLMAFPLLGWALGVPWWALLWQVLYLPHNLAGWSRNWVYKDLVIGLGTTVQLAAAWQLSGPITSTGWRWIAALSVAVLAPQGLDRWTAWLADLLVGLLSLWIAVRSVIRRTPAEDHVTYRRFEQRYSALLIASIVVL
jgi:hypothetical protein